MSYPAQVSDASEVAATGRYKGIRKRKWGKWVSEVRLPNSRDRIWLGSYDSAEKAARAFDAASFILRGSRARLNFPHQTSDIILHCGPRGATTPQQIQAAAARYAHALSPPHPVAGTSEDLTQTTSASLPGELVMDWNLMEELTASTFPEIDEFCYEWLHPAEAEQEEPMEFSGVFAHGSCLWNF